MRWLRLLSLLLPIGVVGACVPYDPYDGHYPDRSGYIYRYPSDCPSGYGVYCGPDGRIFGGAAARDDYWRARQHAAWEADQRRRRLEAERNRQIEGKRDRQNGAERHRRKEAERHRHAERERDRPPKSGRRHTHDQGRHWPAEAMQRRLDAGDRHRNRDISREHTRQPSPQPQLATGKRQQRAEHQGSDQVRQREEDARSLGRNIQKDGE